MLPACNIQNSWASTRPRGCSAWGRNSCHTLCFFIFNYYFSQQWCPWDFDKRNLGCAPERLCNNVQLSAFVRLEAALPRPVLVGTWCAFQLLDGIFLVALVVVVLDVILTVSDDLGRNKGILFCMFRKLYRNTLAQCNVWKKSFSFNLGISHMSQDYFHQISNKVKIKWRRSKRHLIASLLCIGLTITLVVSVFCLVWLWKAHSQYVGVWTLVEAPLAPKLQYVVVNCCFSSSSFCSDS